MKVFVTGGTGFIGSHLIDYLIEQGIEVRALVRNKEKWLEGKNYVRIDGDLDDLGALKKGMDGVDIVFHLAGLVMAREQEIFDRTNVESTENVYRIGLKTKVKHLVVLSSMAASGPSNGKPATENENLAPISMYGRSKKKMEERLRQIADPSLPVTILRPPAVYGPREEQIFTVFKIAQKGFFPMVGSGDYPLISLIYVRDLVQGIWLAAKEPKKPFDVYFVSSNRGYTWNEICDATRIAFGKRVRPIHLNPLLVCRLGSISENIGAFFGYYPVFNSDKANEMALEWVCSSNKAYTELGYSQHIDLDIGIRETINWYKKHLWL